MPHFGLMDEDALGPVEGTLMRAKLHMRCGRRRLHQSKISMGIITLYDAINSAMQWYIAAPEHMKNINIKEGEDTRDDRTAFEVLRRSGVIENFDYSAFDRLVAEALDHELDGFDYQNTLESIETVMTRLGLMPFDENKLLPEDPDTF